MNERIQEKLGRLRHSRIILFLFPLYEITRPHELSGPDKYQQTGELYIHRVIETAVKQGTSMALQQISSRIQSGLINREEFLQRFENHLGLLEENHDNNGKSPPDVELENSFLIQLRQHYPDIYAEIADQYPILYGIFGSDLDHKPPISDT